MFNAPANLSWKGCSAFRVLTFQSIPTGVSTNVIFDQATQSEGWIAGSPSVITVPAGVKRATYSAGVQFSPASLAGVRQGVINFNGLATFSATTLPPASAAGGFSQITLPVVNSGSNPGTLITLSVFQNSGIALDIVAVLSVQWHY